jgi:XTP/dITP diphosphohydrolase
LNLIVATSNFHKAREISEILSLPPTSVLTLKDIGFTDPIEETGQTFQENAKIKLLQVRSFLLAPTHRSAAISPRILLADDSGLEVDSLKGAPGVYSARYAGEPTNHQLNIEKLLHELQGLPGFKRTAQFRCVLAAAIFDETPIPNLHFFEGICRGKIGFQCKGDQGFGYDPIFFPEGYCRTLAEMDAEEKNAVSHRGHAMAQFKEWLQAQIP